METSCVTRERGRRNGEGGSLVREDVVHGRQHGPLKLKSKRVERILT